MGVSRKQIFPILRLPSKGVLPMPITDLTATSFEVAEVADADEALVIITSTSSTSSTSSSCA